GFLSGDGALLERAPGPGEEEAVAAPLLPAHDQPGALPAVEELGDVPPRDEEGGGQRPLGPPLLRPGPGPHGALRRAQLPPRQMPRRGAIDAVEDPGESQPGEDRYSSCCPRHRLPSVLNSPSRLALPACYMFSTKLLLCQAPP